jgi:DNA invertase Pin-like site-specific DNA recombinase
VHFVVVFNLTRFARDKYDHFALRSHPQALGISLRSATEPIDDTSTGKLMEGVLAAFAQFDNDVSSEWTRAGMRAPILRRIFEDYPTGQSRSSSVGGTRRLAEQPREAPHRMEDLLEQGSSEMALRERAARTGLQVVLESDGAPFVRELHQHIDLPRLAIGRVRTTSRIVRGQSRIQIRGHASVVTRRVADAAQDVNGAFGNGHRAALGANQ